MNTKRIYLFLRMALVVIFLQPSGLVFAETAKKVAVNLSEGTRGVGVQSGIHKKTDSTPTKADLLNQRRIEETQGKLVQARQAQTLRAADQISEQFMNGMTPISADKTKRKLDEYYRQTEDRLSESERRSQYARAVGEDSNDSGVTRNRYFQGQTLEENDLAVTGPTKTKQGSSPSRNAYFDGQTLKEKDLKTKQEK